MKVRMSAALLLLLSLCAAPMQAMQEDDELVTPEMRETVDRFLQQCDISFAVGEDNHKAVEELLSRGADPNHYTRPHSAEFWARTLNSYARASRSISESDLIPKESLLHHALPGGGRDRIIRVLLRYGADPDGLPQSEYTLHTALQGYQYIAAQLFLAYGANPNRTIENPNPQYLEADYPSPLDWVLFLIEAFSDGDHTFIDGNTMMGKILLTHGARAHGPEFKDLPYHKLCTLIGKAEDPDISDAEAHEKQRQFTLDHWNIRNTAEFILNRKLGLVKGMPRCKCWDVVESLDDA